jgi:hypothetical protein
MNLTHRGAWLLCVASMAGCGDVVSVATMDDASVDGAVASDVTPVDGARCVTEGRFATRVVSFRPGEGAGFGSERMPEIVLGPPRGGGEFRGGTDVVSLGAGGEIVLSFDTEIVDGPGTDFVVFENAFQVPGTSDRFWEELGEVSVSADNKRWSTFSCNTMAPRPRTGCAGWNVVYPAPDNMVCATNPNQSGGDGFDLATVGVTSVRYVRIRDLRTQGSGSGTTGFDLDAVAIVNGR